MAVFDARVVEIGLDGGGRRWVRLTCPADIRSAAGQYMSAWAHEQVDAPLSQTLFPAELFPDGFRCAPPAPESWVPGMTLQVRGPLGHGFEFFNTNPAGAQHKPRRLALAALGNTAERLLPMASLALASGAGVALFTDGLFPALPPVIEVYPLSELPLALAWADALALDLPLAQLPQVRTRLGLPEGRSYPCPVEALITTDMPCAGLGECGICAVQTDRGWVKLCEAGPVLTLA